MTLSISDDGGSLVFGDPSYKSPLLGNPGDTPGIITTYRINDINNPTFWTNPGQRVGFNDDTRLGITVLSRDGTTNIRTNRSTATPLVTNEIVVGVYNGFEWGIVDTITENDGTLKLGTACDANVDGSTFVVAGEGFGVGSNQVGFRVYDFDGVTATQRGGDVITPGFGDLLAIQAKNKIKINDDGDLISVTAKDNSGFKINTFIRIFYIIDYCHPFIYPCPTIRFFPFQIPKF